MMTGFRLNFTPLKEPLGFVKLVEWLTAIFAFGSCGGFSGKNIVTVLCGDGSNQTLDADFHYPFRLAQVPLVAGNATICNRSVSATHLVGDSASSAEFFVGVATVCFLYSMLALLVYLGYMHVYKDSDFGPMFVSMDGGEVLASLLELVRDSGWFPGLPDHGQPGLPLAGVLLRLGQGPAEREGRHGHRGHLVHAGCVQQPHLPGHRVRQPANPQHLCGVRLPQHAGLGWKRLVCVQGDPLALPQVLLPAGSWKTAGPGTHLEQPPKRCPRCRNSHKEGTDGTHTLLGAIARAGHRRDGDLGRRRASD